MDNMDKSQVLIISFISIIIFNILFLIILAFYKDIILIEPSLESFSREYYNWLMTRPPAVNNESIVIKITLFLKLMFSLIFSAEFFYIIFNKKYTDVIGKKNIIIALIIGFAINYFISAFIRYNVQHYRLFMTLISIEVSSLILLYIIVKFRKASDAFMY